MTDPAHDLSRRIADLPPARRQLLEALLRQQAGSQPAAPAASYAAPRTEVERTLAEIWQAALGVARIGIHDNFFELGGDSIHSIQIIARARQAGLSFTNTDLFERPTIAELAGGLDVTRPTPDARYVEPAVGDEVPLTPIQQWFFELLLDRPAHWNQAVLLDTPWTAADEPLVRAVFARIAAAHDALRLRFERSGGEWRQTIGGGHAELVSVVDLSSIPEDQRAAARAAAIAGAQTSLDLRHGPLVRLLLLRGAAGTTPATDQALLVAHHLVVDAVSFRVLLEELGLGVAAARRGAPVSQPAVAAPFSAWAGHARRLAASGSLDDELPYWRGQIAGLTPAPLDTPGGANMERDARRLTVTLDAAETSALRARGAGRGPSVHHILLGALSATLAGWMDTPDVGFWLEGHGRDDDAIDLSRTVGWLTTLFPVVFRVPSAAAPDGATALLRGVGDTLAAVPGKGRGFGLLRYMHPDQSVREALRHDPAADILFNYLGTFDDNPSDGKGLRVLEDVPPALYDPEGRRPQALQIYGGIYHGELRLHWVHSAAQYAPDTIGALAKRFLANVRTLADAATRMHAEDGHARTDAFDEAGLSAADRAAVLAAHERD